MFASGMSSRTRIGPDDHGVAEHLERPARRFGADASARCAHVRRGHPAAERGDTVRRLRQAVFREASGADSVDDRGVDPLDRLLVQVVAEPE